MKINRYCLNSLRRGGGSCGDQRGVVRGTGASTCAGKPMMTRVLAIPTVLAAGIACAPLAQAVGTPPGDYVGTCSNSSGVFHPDLHLSSINPINGTGVVHLDGGDATTLWREYQRVSDDERQVQVEMTGGFRPEAPQGTWVMWDLHLGDRSIHADTIYGAWHESRPQTEASTACDYQLVGG
jgi:hypothetical protein